MAIRRFQQTFPGIPVTLASTGQTFAAVAVERLAPVVAPERVAA